MRRQAPVKKPHMIAKACGLPWAARANCDNRARAGWLSAALPSASNAALLAERFDARGGRVARVSLVSTVLSFFSFSAAVALLTGL